MKLTRIRFTNPVKQNAIPEVHKVVHESGDLLVPAFKVIQEAVGEIHCLRDEGYHLLVAEMKGGYTLRVEVISTRSLPVRKH